MKAFFFEEMYQLIKVCLKWDIFRFKLKKDLVFIYIKIIYVYFLNIEGLEEFLYRIV